MEKSAPDAVADEMTIVIETLENIKKGRRTDWQERRIARVVLKNSALRPKLKIRIV